MPSSDVEKVFKEHRCFNQNDTHCGYGALGNQAKYYPCPLLIKEITHALTSAHAQGYKEGVEAAAKVAASHRQDDDIYLWGACAKEIAAAIRQLGGNNGK